MVSQVYKYAKKEKKINTQLSTEKSKLYAMQIISQILKVHKAKMITPVLY